jgi:NifB/MoaA-like Fe-S oxidoreductase
VSSVSGWQEIFRSEAGPGFVYASDELYLACNHDIPSAEDYDGFPQLENGVGLVRDLLDDWAQFRAEGGAARVPYGHAAVVCGELIAPVLAPMLSQLSVDLGCTYDLYPIKNRFFGGSVSVSGLLTGQDIIGALRRRDLGEVVVLPRSMFDQEGERTLDEMSPTEIAASLRTPVRQARCVSELPFLAPVMGEPKPHELE